jgi:hypothetical protein
MIPTTRGLLNTLRIGLLVSAIGWGISFYFTFASWSAATNQLYGMGAGPIAYHPLFDYWLRMASSVFGSIGVGSAMACVRPQVFASFIRLLGPFHFAIGITLSVAAFANRLTPQLHPTFVPDIVFCFLVGTLIQLPILLARKSIQNARPQSP